MLLNCLKKKGHCSRNLYCLLFIIDLTSVFGSNVNKTHSVQSAARSVGNADLQCERRTPKADKLYDVINIQNNYECLLPSDRWCLAGDIENKHHGGCYF